MVDKFSLQFDILIIWMVRKEKLYIIFFLKGKQKLSLRMYAKRVFSFLKYSNQQILK